MPVKLSVYGHFCFLFYVRNSIKCFIAFFRPHRISEVCEFGMPLNFYMARHTFATTVTLLNGVPITSIKKMMGHKKIESTLLYAKVNRAVVAKDMMVLQKKIDLKM